jgi:hypothetical protein
MGTPFSDITLYTPTPYPNDTPEYWQETSLINYISDLYISKMHGYKPPNTTRVSIVPAYHKVWNRTWKDGSLISIAPEFIYEKYTSLNKHGKYEYILNIIHNSMLQLSDEYQWKKQVFENAYKEVIACNFAFKKDYPAKLSRDRKKSARLIIEKTEVQTSLFVQFEIGENPMKVLLLNKRNWWWYDSSYDLAKNTRWFDNDRFGVVYKPFNFSAWYNLAKHKTEFELSGQIQQDFNIESLFKF